MSGKFKKGFPVVLLDKMPDGQCFIVVEHKSDDTVIIATEVPSSAIRYAKIREVPGVRDIVRDVNKATLIRLLGGAS